MAYLTTAKKKNPIFASHFFKNEIEYRKNAKKASGYGSGEYAKPVWGSVEAWKIPYEASLDGLFNASEKKKDFWIFPNFREMGGEFGPWNYGQPLF